MTIPAYSMLESRMMMYDAWFTVDELIEKAKRRYVQGWCSLDDLERRVEEILRREH